MFTWSLIDLFGLFLFFFAYRFLYAFITGSDLPVWQTAIGIILIVPTAITTFLGANLVGFESNICEVVESPAVVAYSYLVQILTILAVTVLAIWSYRKTSKKIERQKIVLATLGILLFLSFFFLANFLVALLVNYTVVEYAYNFSIYGLFGMPILLMFLGYLIVKYKAFSIKMLGAQALILALVLIDASQIFFSSSRAEFVVNLLTLFLVIIFGYFLIKSVKLEIAARERNEELAKDLARANTRLRELDRQKSEFVSIASHQLRSPLTSIRGYASMLLDGSYGKITKKAEEALGRIQESSSFMALSIEDFLNVSRIEQGKMKYECAEINVVEMASTVVDEMRAAALKKGLTLSFSSECKSKGLASVDPGKMRQVLYNLIDNALKYTTEGTITVSVKDDLSRKSLIISITDTGIGMSEETMGSLFDKFVRAKNANNINITGSGLGLYVAKQLMRAMHGEVTAASPGEGKGSTFTITLPLLS